MPPHRASRLVTVFQAANADLKELYLGWTDHLMDRLAAEFASRRPEAVAHWKREHAVALTLLAYAVPSSELPGYLERLDPGARFKGWTVIRDP